MLIRRNFLKTTLWVVLLAGMQVHAASQDTLNVSTTVSEGGCDINVPTTLDLGGVYTDDLMKYTTGSVRPLNVVLSNCIQGAKTRAPSIDLDLWNGSQPLSGKDDVFYRPAGTTATHAGVAIREGNYTGSLGGFYVPGKMVSKSNPRTYQMKTGEKIVDGVYPYTVGLVGDGITPGLGSVEANLTFTVVYH